MKPLYNLDRVTLEHGVLLLQGWVMPTSADSLELRLKGCSSDGQSWTLAIALNRQRPDVCESLKLPLERQNCGFFYYAALPEGQLCSLQACMAHEVFDLYIWVEQKGRTSMTQGLSAWRLRLGTWRYLGRRAWTLLRAGQWLSLKARVQRHLHSAWHARRAVVLKSELPEDNAPVDCLVIDHDLGGGANQYRRRAVEELLEQERNVQLLTFSVLGLRYTLYRLVPSGQKQLLAQLPWAQVLKTIERLQPAHIFYNNAVSFPQALALVQGLADLKAKHQDLRLTLTTHDYFALCPSQHLMHADGHFCGLPEISECQDCLARSQHSMVALYRHHGLVAWRQAWGRLLQCADEVLAFDPSAQQLLERVYPPAAVPVHWVLRPHQVKSLSAREQQQLQTWQMSKIAASGRIGVVGSIESEAKGAGQVQALVKAIAASGKPYEVVVIGQLNPQPSSELPWRETGPYQEGELTEKIIAHDIDMFFFSSLVPETFSYVLHELERYQMPIAAFNFGAQSTFLANYASAIILQQGASGQEILEKIEPYLKPKT